MKTPIQLFVLLAAIIIVGCAQIPDTAVAVKPFNKEKYLGKWYEIARFDYKFERNMNNVTATYSLNDDGTIKVQNRGYNFVDKEWKDATGKAKSAGDADEAKLKVSFFGPFYSGYNVVAIDENYTNALVAGKNLDYLWLLSRSKTMPEETKLKYLKLAKQIGYDTDALIWVEHGGE